MQYHCTLTHSSLSSWPSLLLPAHANPNPKLLFVTFRVSPPAHLETMVRRVEVIREAYVRRSNGSYVHISSHLGGHLGLSEALYVRRSKLGPPWALKRLAAPPLSRLRGGGRRRGKGGFRPEGWWDFAQQTICSLRSFALQESGPGAYDRCVQWLNDVHADVKKLTA